MAEWSHEPLYPEYRQSIRIDRMLYDSASEHQRLQLFENARFGRVLTLDGVVQTTEADEFIYHEMMAHVPILAHGAVRRVLIIGGGDGGLAREVLRHAAIEHVTMVEIDPAVVAFAREYLPSLSAGAFDDPRLELVIADGAEFVARPGPRYDVILIDSTDPIGPGEALFTDSFYGAVKNRLADAGILVTQNGVPFFQAEELKSSLRSLAARFREATCYLATVPTYSGGPMAFGWATDGRAGAVGVETLRARLEAAGLAPRYYTPEVHKAAFALPVYVQRLLPGQGR